MSGRPGGAAGSVAELAPAAELEAAAEPQIVQVPSEAAAEPTTAQAREAASARDPSEPAVPDADDPAPAMDVLLSRDARRPATRGESAVPGVVIGTIVGANGEGRPLVRWPSGPESGVPAVPVWMREAPPWSECAGLRAVVGFEVGDESRPLLLGLLDPPPAVAADPAAADQPLRTQRIEGGEELVLQCGDAKIVLRADGSITILGAKVVSRARGVNKVKGGSVQIN